ncbi:CBS domain-containing protein [Rhodomicrobium vannielii]|jgi:CBS domain-containing protein|uniref:CBS domain-containing protein n=1 Tax=Rhodomicrobium vannielii TaxID=1069 RepID=UPI001FF02C23|nr:CBS domain-containing protein [Rhodomicrobium vannielii]
MPMHRFLEWHASQFMTKDVESVPSSLTLRELGALFDHNDYNSFPVVDNDVLVGLVTKLDFLKAFIFDTSHLMPHYGEVMSKTVGEVMMKDIVHVELETPLTKVLELMVKLRTRGFPVLDEGKLVGFISRTDLTHALTLATRDE